MKMTLIIGSLTCLMFLIMTGIFYIQIIHTLKHKPVKNQFKYVRNQLERYTDIQFGKCKDIPITMEQYAINVNPYYFIIDSKLVYMFDRSKILFAVHEINTNQTHLFNFDQALKIFNELEFNYAGFNIANNTPISLPINLK